MRSCKQMAEGIICVAGDGQAYYSRHDCLPRGSLSTTKCVIFLCRYLSLIHLVYSLDSRVGDLVGEHPWSR